MRSIDLRSDTVTQPSPEMRAAMAAAEVGDDVLEQDPTLARLEARVADLLGMEAALWVPSGCMGNLIALMLHLKRGDRFLAPAQAHVLGSELGTGAWLAGGMPEALAWEGGPGRPTAAQVTKAAGSQGPYYTLRTTLLCLENTHNFAGGTVTPRSEHRALVGAAKAAKLAVHLDGARLWHAATAQGLPPAALTEGVDTVQVCLSKGLGAPMGSLLGGSKPAILEARRLRKMLGGGVRQGGVMGAAGLVALEYLPRLSEDHAKTQRLAEGLRNLGVQAPHPETNILLVPVPDAAAALAALESVGVRTLPVGSAIRFIPHRDLALTDIEEALRRMEPVAHLLRSA
ncbi:low specificity L-threonine aldolase [Geothrix sp. PMB-07]|uniref:threonine aldolase family protein n=1 Tax=Geothrix sp. PMB-07 TaxID=3068640 RepID=UPI002740712A|nr:GntG family PLP-dependent aldolase [Geothrix sp. PMB-07]WLT30224.1 GntG family PLP-dependent aldolase [Geothrix sp. PMB-07]